MQSGCGFKRTAAKKYRARDGFYIYRSLAKGAGEDRRRRPRREEIEIWEVAKGRHLHTIRAHDFKVYALAFSHPAYSFGIEPYLRV